MIIKSKGSIMKISFSLLLVYLLLFSLFCDKQPVAAEIETDIIYTPHEAIEQMMRGINLGNTLEPDTEGGWNNGPVQEYYFDDYQSAGFQCVRIPVKWGSHTSESSPFDINLSWLNRVEEVVDWGLERGLFIIINGHHEGWLKDDYSLLNITRYENIWTQISERFKDKSHRLLFEMINEPHGLTDEQTNDLNFRILPIIRETNPTRIVIFSGSGWSSLNDMMNAAIPDDDYLMAYFHAYDPWNFGGLGNGIWGSSADRNAISSMFEQAANWSATHNIPVMISEFGAVHACDYNSRMLHYFTYVEEALKNNIAFQAWDDGGMFGIYNRNSRTWPEVKNILLDTSPMSPVELESTLLENGTVQLSWQNSTSENISTIVERKTLDTDFLQIAVLSFDATTFEDTEVQSGSYFYYRILSELSDQSAAYSYPILASNYSPPTERANFLGEPFQIPGIIQAEDFDIGGEGWTYHDNDDANITGAYRPFEGVDIEVRNDGGYQIAYIETGEWVEYTIQVTESRMYEITIYTASMNSGGQLRFQIATSFSGFVDITASNSWQDLNSVTTSMYLHEGESFLRLHFMADQPFNLDRFVIQ